MKTLFRTFQLIICTLLAISTFAQTSKPAQSKAARSETEAFAVVLRGGKLLAFLDPHAYFDQGHDRNHDYSMVGDNAAKSSLDKLLKAWGLDMDVNKVAADTSFAKRCASRLRTRDGALPRSWNTRNRVRGVR